MRRGQLTLLMVLGLVIVIAVGLVLWLNRANVELLHPPEAQPIVDYVENCLNIVTVPGAFLLGSQGGHIIVPADAVDPGPGAIGYGYRNGNVLPSVTQMEQELATHITLQLPTCANLSLFERQGWNITPGDIRTRVTLSDDEILVRTTWTLGVAQQEFSARLSDFTARVQIPLLHDYNDAQLIVKKIQQDPRSIDTSFLAALDREVGVFPASQDTLVYAIRDPAAEHLGRPFVFSFAALVPVNRAPVIFVQRNLTLKDGQPFTLDVNATDADNDTLTYSDDTFLFDLNPETGNARFTPDIPGKYNITVSVADGTTVTNARIALAVIP